MNPNPNQNPPAGAPKLTNQQFFDNAVTGVIGQGGPSTGGDTCLYRSPDGKKCAAGNNLLDEEYDAGFEFGQTPGGMIAADLCNRLPRWSEIDVALAAQCQGDHDYAYYDSFRLGVAFLPDYVRRSRDTAAAFGLDTTALDAAVAKAGL
jgi:hypothetical protein